MFEITATTEALLATLTSRSEKHGDDEVPAVSLGLKLTVANQLLDLIDPTIRQALWKAKDDQEDLPGVEPTTPVLRCNSIELVKLPRKFTGWTLHVDDGINESEPITFGGCKVDAMSIEPLQGGSAVLRMRVGTSDLDAERSGFLGMHVAQPIWIRLTGPQPGDVVDDGDGEPSATDLFVEGAAAG